LLLTENIAVVCHQQMDFEKGILIRKGGKAIQ